MKPSLLLPLLLLSTLLHAADWARWRGPAANGTTPEKVAPETWDKEGPRRLWKAKVGVGFTAATVAEGRLYTMGNLEKGDVATLWCLNAETGALLWKREWPSKLVAEMYEGGPNSTPVVDGDRLYAIVKPTLVVCLDAAKGDVRWEKQMTNEFDCGLNEWGITGSSVVAGDKLIVNYGTAGTALDKLTGRLLWKTGEQTPSYNVPALTQFHGEPMMMVFATNHLAAIRLRDGAEQWQVPFGRGYFCHAADPVVNGESVYVGSADDGGMVVRYGKGQPEVLWKHRQMGNFMASSVVRDGHLYGINVCDAKGTAGAELKCVEWESGTVKWATNGFGFGSFIFAGDRLLALSDKGELSVAHATPEKFELIRRDQVIGGKCWTPPSLANGRLYVRNAAGDLVCLEVGTAKQG
ncbi:MAG TPA: PQQ-binding-like beta-propeller repeat protein [Candidatus Limnocylindria bacterium]|jgi:outer membrane protein assembly factor BamB|nr:PQQ-binding-like beta-propeller repeat protein [Candidatus Limnocylindria bacterium]